MMSPARPWASSPISSAVSPSNDALRLSVFPFFPRLSSSLTFVSFGVGVGWPHD